MHHSYTETQRIPEKHNTASTNANSGAMLSIIGLIAWLFAMTLAIAGPLLNIAIPSDVIIGMVLFSGLFSLFSLPRLFTGNYSKEDK